MTLPLASWIGAALEAEDLNVKYVAGWKTRGRPYSFEPTGLTLWHHTAAPKGSGNAPSLGVVTDGRPGIPGPLAQLLIARDRTVYVVAAGYANHAGLGGPYKTVPANSGNRYAYGFEVENAGDGSEPWSDELRATCRTVARVLVTHHHRDQTWMIGHKEWAPGRKIDPNVVDMNEERRLLAAEMEGDVAPTKDAGTALSFVFGMNERWKKRPLPTEAPDMGDGGNHLDAVKNGWKYADGQDPPQVTP